MTKFHERKFSIHILYRVTENHVLNEVHTRQSCEMKTTQSFILARTWKLFPGHVFLPVPPNFSLSSSLLGRCALENVIVWKEHFFLWLVICSQIKILFLNNVTVQRSDMSWGGIRYISVLPQLWLWTFSNLQQCKISCMWWGGRLIFQGGEWGVLFCSIPLAPLWWAHQSTKDVHNEF